MVPSYEAKLGFHSREMNTGKSEAHVSELEDAVGPCAINDSKELIDFTVGISNKFDFHRLVLIGYAC
jgi:hypothetical protein